MTGSPHNRRQRGVRALRGISRDRHPETGLPPAWITSRKDSRIISAQIANGAGIRSHLAAAWWRAQDAWDHLTRWIHWCRQLWGRR